MTGKTKIEEKNKKVKTKPSTPRCRQDYCTTPYQNVTFAEDPFAAEIWDDYTKVWQCENCRENSLWDI